MAVDEAEQQKILENLCNWAKGVSGFKDILVFGSLFDETFGAEQSDLDLALIFDETADQSPKSRLETLEKFKQKKFEVETLMQPYFKDQGKSHVSPLFVTGFELDYDIVKKVPNHFFRMSGKEFYSLSRNIKLLGPYSQSGKKIIPQSLNDIIKDALKKVQENRDEFLKHGAAQEYHGNFKTLKNMGSDFPKDLARLARQLGTPHDRLDLNIDHGMQDLIRFCKSESDQTLYNKIVHFTGRQIPNGIESDHLTAFDQMWLWEVLAKQAVLNALNYAAGEFMQTTAHTLASLERLILESGHNEKVTRISQFTDRLIKGDEEVYHDIQIEKIRTLVDNQQFTDAVNALRQIYDSHPDRSFAREKLLELTAIPGQIHKIDKNKRIRKGTQEYRDSEERELSGQLHLFIEDLANH